jgi:hypothetical protein
MGMRCAHIIHHIISTRGDEGGEAKRTAMNGTAICVDAT